MGGGTDSERERATKTRRQSLDFTVPPTVQGHREKLTSSTVVTGHSPFVIHGTFVSKQVMGTNEDD